MARKTTTLRWLTYVLALAIAASGYSVSGSPMGKSDGSRRRSGRGAPTQKDISSCSMPPKELNVPARQFSFQNETGQSIEIEWLGEDSKTMFVLCSYVGKKAGPSGLWRSTNQGLYYNNDTSKVLSTAIRPDHGLLKSPADPSRAILVAAGATAKGNSIVFVTSNSGVTWNRVSLPFPLKRFVFHPSRSHLLLASSATNPMTKKRNLYLSTDFGASWKRIINDVYSFAWGSTGDKEETIYASYGLLKDRRVSTLSRTDDLTKHWKVILPKLQHFLISTRFVFASIGRPGKNMRDLYVSERSGANHTWLKARLPYALSSGSYYVLDSHEHVAFVHLDMTGTGTGTLYTSDAQGVNYAVSLRNHLHHHGSTDFYVVKSMRATYISTVAASNDPTAKRESRITFNRGGRWHPLRVGDCAESGGSECTLHLHGVMGMKQGPLKTISGPLSVKHVHGLIIAHGMVGKYADTGKADVYVSRNGGYQWKKVLTGTHKYTIGDLGKLIVAVPINVHSHIQDTLYYSENYGQCWHSSKFSTTPWHFTGLLADPISMGMQVTLWGYTASDGIWQTVTMEFQDIVERKCNDDDFETFHPHLENKDDTEAAEGCVMGYREAVQTVKANAWCRQAKGATEVTVTTSPCSCTRADFECDYGYILVSGECKFDKSVPSNQSRAMKCAKGEDQYRRSSTGYRQIPGDHCDGGVRNNYLQWVWVDCKGHEDLSALDRPTKKNSASAGTVIVILIALVAFAGGVIVCLRRKRACERMSGGSAHYVPVRQREESSTDTDDNDEALLDVSKPPPTRKSTAPARPAPPPAAVDSEDM